MISDKFSVLITGAGQIAAGYDAPDSDAVLTHAHAIISHPQFDLVGFHDIDIERAKQASLKWGGGCFSTLQKADVIVICTPDDVHLESIKQAVALEPRFIILEKPVARQYKDVLEIQNLAKDIPVQVNFTRRFVPTFQELAASKDSLGAFLTGAGLYGKGFIHNGSHMIDLLRLIVGEIESLEVFYELYDFYSDDPTKTLVLRFIDGEFYMRGVDCKHYTIFELDLCFEKARIQILDGGRCVKIYNPVDSQIYDGYVVLNLHSEKITEIDHALLNLYQNVYDHLTCGSQLLSPIDGAVVKGL